MRKALLDGKTAALCGLSAWVAWWFVYIFLGFAAFGNEAIAFFLSGIPIAACASVILGTWYGPNANIPAICVGWAISLAITPATVLLMKSYARPSGDRLGLQLMLASVFGVGILGAITGTGYSRDRNSKRLLPLAAFTIAITGFLAFGMIVWKW